MKEFLVCKKGDRVTWTSGANGGVLTKTGTVIEVVPAGSLPTTHETLESKRGYGQRKRESYVVYANGKTYWPFGGGLQRA